MGFLTIYKPDTGSLNQAEFDWHLMKEQPLDLNYY